MATMQVVWKVEDHVLCVDGQAISIPGRVDTVAVTKVRGTTQETFYGVFISERMLAMLRGMLEELMATNPEVGETAIHMARVNALGGLLRQIQALKHTDA